ncbi:MAG: exonuclease subunit SbcD [Acidimicrobiales bacterium]
MTGQSAGNNTATTGIAVPLRDPAAARIFHTSDWHLGVTVRNRSRADDHDAAIAELTAIAQAAAPDLIVHTGDLFDGHRPPMADFGRAIVALRNLAEIAPVVVLAGNHDSAAALEVLGTAVGDELPDQLASGPYDPLAPCRHRIRIHARPATAAKGAVATYSSAAGVDIRLTALPFVHANRVLKEFDQLAEANTTYADKLREIVDLLTKTALTDFDPSRQVAVFASHVHVTEAALSSERTVHVSTDYATDAGHLPAAYGYLAFGHIHVPSRSPVAGVAMPDRFSRSTSVRRARPSRWSSSTSNRATRPPTPDPAGGGAQLRRVRRRWQSWLRSPTISATTSSRSPSRPTPTATTTSTVPSCCPAPTTPSTRSRRPSTICSHSLKSCRSSTPADRRSPPPISFRRPPVPPCRCTSRIEPGSATVAAACSTRPREPTRREWSSCSTNSSPPSSTAIPATFPKTRPCWRHSSKARSGNGDEAGPARLQRSPLVPGGHHHRLLRPRPVRHHR